METMFVIYAAYSEKRLKVVHRHGPCSPLGHRKQLDHERVLRQDRHRVQSLHRRRASALSKLGSSLATATVPGRSGLALGSGDYIVNVGFGTPKQDKSVIFDTGSDLAWIQCRQCHSCYPQNEPLFDPSKSSTFSRVGCDSDYCSSDSTFCAASTCNYEVHYGDGSYSDGDLVQDTLTLTPSNELKDFAFGCGVDSAGFFGEVAGLIGLGRGRLSLVSQSSQVYGGAFSYCIPPFASSTGYLTLGPGKQSPNTQFTSLLSNSDMSYYFVELIGLSVGGKGLQIPPGSFANPGTIIDSGTVLTYLPSDAYLALRSEFRRRMSKYPLAPPVHPLDTCYDLTGYNRVMVPEVALLFSGGVTLNVDASGILLVMDISQACLAFVANQDSSISIIGNMQQKTYDVVYDVPNGKLGFAAGGCG
ncbi:aspartyl protease family protein [Canna indica]|uniref:Aspartyl protease family protein n=1 Tax=Canna indica TaxID=4628 RepID=A0AAQ3QKE7_9LILI|nr:aspartyl protease family protein [Canna indica]